MDLRYQPILCRYPFLQTLIQLYNNYYALDEQKTNSYGKEVLQCSETMGYFPVVLVFEKEKERKGISHKYI